VADAVPLAVISAIVGAGDGTCAPASDASVSILHGGVDGFGRWALAGGYIRQEGVDVIDGQGAGTIVPERAAPARPRATGWPAYAAGAWAFVFAAMSLYWAAGGLAGLDTQGHAIKQAAIQRTPGFVALLWATGAAKLLGGLLALALARLWGRARRPLLALAWAGGVGMAAYGGIPLVVNGLMLAGILRVAGPVDWTAIRWHFVLWDPWWLLGGILFGAAAWSARPSRHGPRPP